MSCSRRDHSVCQASASRILKKISGCRQCGLSSNYFDHLHCDCDRVIFSIVNVLHALCFGVDLSKNDMNEIPYFVYTCWSLENLNCHYNVIRSLPDEIERLQNLLVLNLRYKLDD